MPGERRPAPRIATGSVQRPRGRSGVRLDRRDAVAGARRYRFLAIVALAQTVAGCRIIFTAVLTAFAVLSPWPGAIVTRVPVEWRERLAPAAIGGVALALILGG